MKFSREDAFRSSNKVIDGSWEIMVVFVVEGKYLSPY